MTYGLAYDMRDARYNEVGTTLGLGRGATLYAYAPSSETEGALQATYPGRTLYLLQVGASGQVTFAPLTR